ncbi:PREDICTED: microtubule-associated tumor suppressor 1 homolog [Propithecus coquereli]|uniref:microtubule-associated tumor suppressor 1 homolog n=1 Tax=Propithecus coquereli TaxID=379532 RepID=UPI00063EEA16|nr:PREDICTED: microtubule-associated tumor suppressor 1 homolog [Propithecus coquereli]
MAKMFSFILVATVVVMARESWAVTNCAQEQARLRAQVRLLETRVKQQQVKIAQLLHEKEVQLLDDGAENNVIDHGGKRQHEDSVDWESDPVRVNRCWFLASLHPDNSAAFPPRTRPRRDGPTGPSRPKGWAGAHRWREGTGRPILRLARLARGASIRRSRAPVARGDAGFSQVRRQQPGAPRRTWQQVQRGPGGRPGVGRVRTSPGSARGFGIGTLERESTERAGGARQPAEPGGAQRCGDSPAASRGTASRVFQVSRGAAPVLAACCEGAAADLNRGEFSSSLELNQTFDIAVDKANHTIISHHAIEKSQSLPTTGSLPPASMKSGNTSSLSYSTRTSSHSDKRHARETSYDRKNFANPQSTPLEARDTTYTAFSDVVMQTEAFVPDTENQCQYSSGKVTSEYTDGSQQRLVGEKEIQALTPVSDGMEVPSGSILQKFFCLSKDEPNSDTHSQSSYGHKELGQHLRETVSSCLIDDECPLVVPAFDTNKAQVLSPEHKVMVTKDTQIASNEKDLGTQNRTSELILSSSPGQNVVSAFELTWEADNMVISTNDTVCMSTPVQEPTNMTLSVSPIKATEKCKKVEKGNRELKDLSNLRGAPVNMSKPSLGKSTTKTNTPIGCKVRKTEIISYPRPNFKNVKAKVMSRPVLQPKDPILSKVPPKPQVTGVCPPSSASNSRQLTVLSKTPRSDLSADTKAEILVNKTHKQQFNKLITGQAVHVTTHSKNASHKVPRTTSAVKSNQEDVDKASSSNSACETGAVAAFFQKIKGMLPVKMESAECLEMTYVSNVDRINPEKKGEKENGTPMEKQELKQEIMNETFEYGSLFLVNRGLDGKEAFSVTRMGASQRIE